MEDSREGKGMTKKDVECQVHTWMIKKAKTPWYIRRRKTEEEKKNGKKEKEKSDL